MNRPLDEIEFVEAPGPKRRVVQRVVERCRRIEQRRLEQRVHERKHRVAGSRPRVGIGPRGEGDGDGEQRELARGEFAMGPSPPRDIAGVQQERREPDDPDDLALHGAGREECEADQRAVRRRAQIGERQQQRAEQEGQPQVLDVKRAGLEKRKRRRREQAHARQCDVAPRIKADQLEHEQAGEIAAKQKFRNRAAPSPPRR